MVQLVNILGCGACQEQPFNTCMNGCGCGQTKPHLQNQQAAALGHVDPCSTLCMPQSRPPSQDQCGRLCFPKMDKNPHEEVKTMSLPLKLGGILWLVIQRSREDVSVGSQGPAPHWPTAPKEAGHVLKPQSCEEASTGQAEPPEDKAGSASCSSPV